MTLAIENTKKINKIVLKIVSGALVSVLYFYFLLSFPTKAQAPILNVLPPTISTVSSQPKNTLTNLVKAQYSKPLSVQIPSIGVNSTIEQVSVDAFGAMEVPKNWQNVGWLTSSSKMGESGNLVLTGHFDTNTGAPAVFYNLNSLSVGDEILVRANEDGAIKQKRYTVTEKYLANPNDQNDVLDAYKSTKAPTITIITCNGIWDNITQQYTHRVIVKGTLKGSTLK